MNHTSFDLGFNPGIGRFTSLRPFIRRIPFIRSITAILPISIILLILLMVTVNPVFGFERNAPEKTNPEKIGPEKAISETSGIYINADMQYEYAQQFFSDNDPSLALVELKRFIHFFPEDKRVPKALFLTGRAYYEQEQYGKAVKTFETFLFPFSQDTLVIESYFMTAKALERMGREGRAETVLQNLLLLTDDIATKDRVHGILGWMALKQSQSMDPIYLKKAEANINKISNVRAGEYSRNRVNETIDSLRKTKKKSPTLAGLYAIFPGMGFLYCERYQDALVSFLLNTSLILAAHESFDNGNPALGGAIAFIEAGFYGGNIYGSISSAHKFNLLAHKRNLELLEQAVEPPL